MHDSEIVAKRGICGYRNYKSDKGEFFKEDFENPSILQLFLDEMCTGESDITELGKIFLLEKFATTGLAQKVIDIGGVTEDGLESIEAIRDRVQSQKPHEVAMFIAEARLKSAEKKIEA
mgnify:FL=1